MIRWLPLTATALLAAGCGQQIVRNAPDPFLGDAPPSKEKSKTNDKEFVGRPAAPPTGSPASTAEIAAGPTGVSLGSPRMVEPKPVEKVAEKSNSLTVARPTKAPSPVEPESNPASGGRESSERGVDTSRPASTPAPATYESLQTALKSRGVTWQQLQCLGNDNWHFICAIPDTSSPGVRENFEVTRPGNLGLNAIKAVLDQIDQERAAPPQPYRP